MTVFEKTAALREIRTEISRINKAAGRTIFNPAATNCLNELIEDALADEGAEVLTDIEAGQY